MTSDHKPKTVKIQIKLIDRRTGKVTFEVHEMSVDQYDRLIKNGATSTPAAEAKFAAIRPS